MLLLLFAISSCHSETETALAPGSGRIHGRICLVTDHPNLLDVIFPCSTLNHGIVILVPKNALDTLSNEIDIYMDEGLHHAVFDIDEDILIKYGGAYSPVQGNGRYVIDAPAGNYLLCLANTGLPIPEEPFPARASGCQEVSSQADERVRIDLSIGMSSVTQD